MRVLRAAVWAAALSGIPSTLHALATGRDPLEAVYAAGTILLPGETRPQRLLAAAVPVHLGISIAWTVVLDRAGVRGAARAASPASRSPRSTSDSSGGAFSASGALPFAPQLADHAAFGAIAGRMLQQ